MSTRKKILANGYDPYKNRERRNASSYVESLANLVKGLVGTGLLAMPEAYRNGGLLAGSIGCLVIGFVIGYCLHLLFNGMYLICKRDKIPQCTYPVALKEGLKIGPNCLSKFADMMPFLVNFFIITFQIGILAIYVVFCSTNIQQVVNKHVSDPYKFSTEIYMVLFLVPMLALCYIKDIKNLAPTSQVANLLTLIGLICTFYLVFEKIEPLEDRYMVAPILQIPLFMGTTTFSVLGVGVILSVEKNMKKGEQWGSRLGVLNVGIFINTFLNIFTGFCGYWRYGGKTASSITLNLRIEHYLAQVVRVLFTLIICFSYPLQSYPATEIIWEEYVEKHMQKSNHKLFWEYILRTNVVLFSFILAVGLPRLGLFISLFGAFCLSALGIIFPPLLDMCIRWPDDLGRGNIILVQDTILILFGLVCFTLGTYSALYSIVVSFM